jgi:hypothetical protein
VVYAVVLAVREKRRMEELYSFPSKPFVHSLCEEDNAEEEKNTRYDELFLSKKRRKPLKYKQQPKQIKPITILDDSDDEAVVVNQSTPMMRENEVS